MPSSASRSGKQKEGQFLSLATSFQLVLQAIHRYCQGFCILLVWSQLFCSPSQPLWGHLVSWYTSVHRMLSSCCSLRSNFRTIWINNKHFFQILLSWQYVHKNTDNWTCLSSCYWIKPFWHSEQIQYFGLCAEVCLQKTIIDDYFKIKQGVPC